MSDHYAIVRTVGGRERRVTHRTVHVSKLVEITFLQQPSKDEWAALLPCLVETGRWRVGEDGDWSLGFPRCFPR